MVQIVQINVLSIEGSMPKVIGIGRDNLIYEWSYAKKNWFPYWDVALDSPRP